MQAFYTRIVYKWYSFMGTITGIYITGVVLPIQQVRDNCLSMYF